MSRRRYKQVAKKLSWRETEFPSRTLQDSGSGILGPVSVSVPFCLGLLRVGCGFCYGRADLRYKS